MAHIATIEFKDFDNDGKDGSVTVLASDTDDKVALSFFLSDGDELEVLVSSEVARKLGGALVSAVKHSAERK